MGRLWLAAMELHRRFSSSYSKVNVDKMPVNVDDSD